MKRSVVYSLLALVATGCLPAGAQTGSDYGSALAAAAVMVAAVGVHRAATGDCWGHCGPGLVCDSASGMCVNGECNPACGTGETCQLLASGPVCGPDPAAGLQISAARPAVMNGSSAQPALPPFVPLPPLGPVFPVTGLARFGQAPPLSQLTPPAAQ